jgi:hypothetical protein
MSGSSPKRQRALSADRQAVSDAVPAGLPAAVPVGRQGRRGRQDRQASAVLTMFDIAEMTPRGKCDIGRWLRRQARFVTMHGYELGHRYVARYLYDPETDLRRRRARRKGAGHDR